MFWVKNITAQDCAERGAFACLVLEVCENKLCKFLHYNGLMCLHDSLGPLIGLHCFGGASYRRPCILDYYCTFFSCPLTFFHL